MKNFMVIYRLFIGQLAILQVCHTIRTSISFLDPITACYWTESWVTRSTWYGNYVMQCIIEGIFYNQDVLYLLENKFGLNVDNELNTTCMRVEVIVACVNSQIQGISEEYNCNHNPLYNCTQNVYTQLISINDYASQGNITNDTNILVNDYTNTPLKLKNFEMPFRCSDMSGYLVTIKSDLFENDINYWYVLYSLQVLVIILLFYINKWWKHWLFIILFILHFVLLTYKIFRTFMICNSISREVEAHPIIFKELSLIILDLNSNINSDKQNELLSSKIITILVILLCLFRKLNNSNKIGD
eukprot:545756_1